MAAAPIHNQIQCTKKNDKCCLSWGSERILEKLWPIKDLRGAPEDKKSRSLPSPDFSPPVSQMPQHRLPPVESANRNVIRSIKLPDHKKLIALTFDLCELADRVSGYDFNIVNYLRDRHIQATFFMGGKWMRSHPEKTMQLIADPLFEIGNHAWSHGNLGIMPDNKIRQQILWTQAQYEILRNELIRRALSQKVSHKEISKVPLIPKVFRLPYGRCRPESLAILAEEGLPVIQWDIVVDENSDIYSPAQVARAIARRVTSGSIILMHANAVPRRTSLILPALIEVLQEQGYHFVTVSELLCNGQPLTVKDGYFERPGDNVQYDHIYGDGTYHPSKKGQQLKRAPAQ